MSGTKGDPSRKWGGVLGPDQGAGWATVCPGFILQGPVEDWALGTAWKENSAEPGTISRARYGPATVFIYVIMGEIVA